MRRRLVVRVRRAAPAMRRAPCRRHDDDCCGAPRLRARMRAGSAVADAPSAFLELSFPSHSHLLRRRRDRRGLCDNAQATPHMSATGIATLDSDLMIAVMGSSIVRPPPGHVHLPVRGSFTGLAGLPVTGSLHAGSGTLNAASAPSCWSALRTAAIVSLSL